VLQIDIFPSNNRMDEKPAEKILKTIEQIE
jgi:hypothetical protein